MYLSRGFLFLLPQTSLEAAARPMCRTRWRWQCALTQTGTAPAVQQVVLGTQLVLPGMADAGGHAFAGWQQGRPYLQGRWGMRHHGRHRVHRAVEWRHAGPRHRQYARPGTCAHTEIKSQNRRITPKAVKRQGPGFENRALFFFVPPFFRSLNFNTVRTGP